MTIEELKLKWEQNLATIEKRMPSASKFPDWDIDNALAGQILEFLDDLKLLAAPAVIKSVCCDKCKKELKPIYLCTNCLKDEMDKKQTVL